MRAIVMHMPAAIESNARTLGDLPTPTPASGEILVRVTACGVCRTDLHVYEGDLAPKHPPIIPGHESSSRPSIVTIPLDEGKTRIARLSRSTDFNAGFLSQHL